MVYNLKDFGSFYIGGSEIQLETGKKININFSKDGKPFRLKEDGKYFVDHMYVQYFYPVKNNGTYPLIFLHGGSMTGVSFENTPDGRDGWLQYFLKKNFQIYNTDSITRGRSGWTNKSNYSTSTAVILPEHDPFIRYRIGKYHKEKKVPRDENTLFPVEYFDCFMKQIVPRWTETRKKSIANYVQLLKKVGPSLILAHSFGGGIAWDVLKEIPEMVKGLILIEPVLSTENNCFNKIVNTPILTIYGDYIEGDDRWKQIKMKNNNILKNLREKGGEIDFLDLPNLGVYGNSHMMMMDKNNLEVAKLILEWMHKRNLYNSEQ